MILQIIKEKLYVTFYSTLPSLSWPDVPAYIIGYHQLSLSVFPFHSKTKLKWSLPVAQDEIALQCIGAL